MWDSLGNLVGAFLKGAGIDDTTGPWYAFWSGFGADLGYITAIAVFLYKHNCHVHGCLRLQWKLHNDEFLCKKHHKEATGRDKLPAHYAVENDV